MSVNLHNDATNYYFSGQGVALIGTRDPVTGKSQRLLPLGNVSDLRLQIASTVLDHKGAQDGQRAIDKRIQTETKATMSIHLQNWVSKNLATALRGLQTIIPAGSAAGESINLWGGAVTGLAKVNVTMGTLVVTQTLGSVTLVEYVNDSTPYDYKWNADAGSIKVNDRSLTAMSAAYHAIPTAVTVGSTTTITGVVPAGTVIGDPVYLSGFAGADAALINGLPVAGNLTVVTTDATATANGTTMTVSANTTAKTITVGTPKAYFPNIALPVTCAYSYSAQQLVDALYNPVQELFFRFEGLNTAITNTQAVSGAQQFSPVVVEVFRFQTDPLKEMALLTDTFGEFVLDGVILADQLRPATGASKFFTIKKLE